MDCQDCLEQLYQYLDKELSEAEVKTIRVHLDDCGGCTDHFFFEARFIEKIQKACADDRAPDQLRERIVLRLREGYVTRERDL
jgi:mycothiol system anti-sigma-R factor